MQRAYFVGGLLASAVAYLGGIAYGTHRFARCPLSVAQLFECMYRQAGLALLCGLPALGVSVLLLWPMIFKEGRFEMWGGAAITMCLVASLVLGAIAGSIPAADGFCCPRREMGGCHPEADILVSSPGTPRAGIVLKAQPGSAMLEPGS
jgi:hypothetical protein